MNRMLSIIHVTLTDSKFHKFDSSYSTLELVNAYAVITNCIFSAEIIETGYSSGALVISRSNISVANSLFTGNRAQNGGAIHATLESNLLIEDSMFDSIKAVWGGAIMVSGSSFISILNSNFSNNIGMYGGAINIEHSEASIAWSCFSNHSAQSDSSWSQYTYGGVLYCNGHATVVIDTVTLVNNRATVGGGIYTNAHCNMSLTGDSSISYNTADNGGAIFTSSNSKLIIGGNSVISNNHANYGGGGIYASSSCVLSLYYDNNVISNNHAQYGGGIYASSYSTVYLKGNNVMSNNQANYGGALYCNLNFVLINQNALLNNTADHGGGVYGHECTISIHNSSFKFNTAVLNFDGGAINGHIELDTYNTNFTNNKVVYGKGGAIHT